MLTSPGQHVEHLLQFHRGSSPRHENRQHHPHYSLPTSQIHSQHQRLLHRLPVELLLRLQVQLLHRRHRSRRLLLPTPKRVLVQPGRSVGPQQHGRGAIVSQTTTGRTQRVSNGGQMDVHRLRRCSRRHGIGAPCRDVGHLQPMGKFVHHHHLSRMSTPLQYPFSISHFPETEKERGLTPLPATGIRNLRPHRLANLHHPLLHPRRLLQHLPETLQHPRLTRH